MQITVNNDFQHGGQVFTQGQINSFLQDEQTAINILDSTFTSNVSVVFDVGFGSYQGQTLQNQLISLADVNTNAAFLLTYSQLRTDLLTFGQPGFFNAANLPAGNSINGVSNFWVSSSVGALFGLFTPRPTASSASAPNSSLAPSGYPPSCTKWGMPWGASRKTSFSRATHTFPRWTCGASLTPTALAFLMGSIPTTRRHGFRSMAVHTLSLSGARIRTPPTFSMASRSTTIRSTNSWAISA